MFGSMTFRVASTAVAAAALLLAACADDDGADGSETATPGTPGVTATATPEATESPSTPEATPTPTASTREPTPTGTELPNPADELIEVEAEIVSAEVISLDSSPPQYVVNVVSAQPDGCHQFARFEVEQDETTFNVTVLNTRPADLSVVLCLAQYSETTSEVPLGTLESGTEYTLNVNGETQTFVAE